MIGRGGIAITDRGGEKRIAVRLKGFFKHQHWLYLIT